MAREHYSDLITLMVVARERSFTRAAAELGISQSMLSMTIRRMEERLGVRLLTRTTRSVSVTEAGERLLSVATPNLMAIDIELRNLMASTNTAAGTVRITASDHAIDQVLWPRLINILRDYPQLNIELQVGHWTNDLLRSHCDFGVSQERFVGKELATARISPDHRYAIVGSSSYLRAHPPPVEPDDLLHHECIRVRPAPAEPLQAWELKKGERPMQVYTNGRLVFNSVQQVLHAAVSGLGLAYVPADMAEPYFQSGALSRVLTPWWGKSPGYHLIYARQTPMPRVMQVLIEALLYDESSS